MVGFYVSSYCVVYSYRAVKSTSLLRNDLFKKFASWNAKLINQTSNNKFTLQGLFLECARWNRETHLLDESFPKILFDTLPIITMTPTPKSSDQSDDEEKQHYDCPIYKTTERRGELATTGHSSNFVMFINLNTDKSPNHWINRGTACICNLDDWI